MSVIPVVALRQDERVALNLPIDNPCSFCEYLAGRRPYTILERDALTAVLVTREQRGVGHVLVIPIKHRRTILDLAPEEAAALIARVQDAARTITDVFSAEGIAVWQNNGVPAHQSIPHVHFHVAATLAAGGTNWGPVTPLSIAETDSIAETLRPRFTRSDGQQK